MIADGWEEEDDLGGLDESVHAGGDGGGAAAPPVAAAATTAMGKFNSVDVGDDDGDDMDNAGDGGDAWGFDDDEIMDDDLSGVGGDEAPPTSAPMPAPAPAPAPTEAPPAAVAAPHPRQQQQQQRPKPPPPASLPPQRRQQPPPPQQQQQQRQVPPPPPQQRRPQPRPRTPPRHPRAAAPAPSERPDPDAAELESELLAYRSLLTATSPLVPSINSVFDAEFNTPEAAAELREYYRDRPELRRYTLETEVPRMEYRISVGGGRVLTDPDDILRRFSSAEGGAGGGGDDDAEELLLRASNQSLLADALSAVTGDDRVVRAHRFHASAVARRCVFDVELRPDPAGHPSASSRAGPGPTRGVSVRCELVVSVPAGVPPPGVESGPSRLDLAALELGIRFEPGDGGGSSAPALVYEITDLQPLLDPDDPSDRARLRSAALSLARDRAAHREMEMEAPPSPDVAHLSRRAHEMLRDKFLSSVVSGEGNFQFGGGLRTAWEQMDAVANVTGKLEALQRNLAGAFPSLPNADELAAAAEEEEEVGFEGHRPTGRRFLDRLDGGGGSGGAVSGAKPGAQAAGQRFLDRIAGGGNGGPAQAAAAGPPPAASAPPSARRPGRPGPPQQRPPPAEATGRQFLDRIAAGGGGGTGRAAAALPAASAPPAAAGRTHPPPMPRGEKPPPGQPQPQPQPQQQRQPPPPQGQRHQPPPPRRGPPGSNPLHGHARAVPPALPAGGAAARPAPLIGGFLMSGLSRLAAAAAVPDDCDFEGGAESSVRPNPPPVAGGPQLYRVDDGTERVGGPRPPPPPGHPSRPHQEQGRRQEPPPPPGLTAGGYGTGLTPPPRSGGIPPLGAFGDGPAPPESGGEGGGAAAAAAFPRLYRTEGPGRKGAGTSGPPASAPAPSPPLGPLADLKEVIDEDGGGGWSEDDDLDLDASEHGGRGGGIRPALAEEVATATAGAQRIPPPGPEKPRALDAGPASGSAPAAPPPTPARPAASWGGSLVAARTPKDSVASESPPAEGPSLPSGSAIVATDDGAGSGVACGATVEGSWSEVSDHSEDFVFVDVNDEDGIIPTRRRWIPRRFRETRGRTPGQMIQT